MLGIMRRSHNRKETEAILNKLRNEIPDAAIRTTLIAGHPEKLKRIFVNLSLLFQTSGLTGWGYLLILMKRTHFHLMSIKMKFLFI